MSSILAIGFLAISSTLNVFPQTDSCCIAFPWESKEILAEGDYTVWLYSTSRAMPTITIGGKELRATAIEKEQRNKDLVWRKAGEVHLNSGTLEMACSPDIFLIFLNMDEHVNPEKILDDMCVLPISQSIGNTRAAIERNTDTVFTMPRYSKEAWEQKASLLRDRILLGSGLYPMPVKSPLNAKVFDESAQDGYTVSKVSFEPWPGFLATGNLYKPMGDGPFPGMINPHGHWKNARVEDEDESCSVPARCITLARMGIVAFAYDMLGHADSIQLSHRWGDEREKLWGLHPFALQLWTSIRAVDFITSLSYVDSERIGCTGASGGGTQTFTVTAVEPRIRIAAPVNMISSTMQGGCLCENAPVLRLDNSNMEIGALTAPRPMLMISTTGDWTRETPRVEYPAIRNIYALYGAEDKLENAHFNFEHNYNKDSREAMYRFMGTHLLGGEWQGFTEAGVVLPDIQDLKLFPDNTLPEGYLSGTDLIDNLVEQAKERRTSRLTHLSTTPIPDSAFAALLGAEVHGVNARYCKRRSMEERGGYVLEKWLLGRQCAGDRIPALFYRGISTTPQDAVLLVHGQGKAYLADLETGGPGRFIQELLDHDKAILVIDTFGVGEYHNHEGAFKRDNTTNFMDTFLPTDTGYRIQDILTAGVFLESRYDLSGAITLVGLEQAGILSIFAGTLGKHFSSIIADMNQFDLDDDQLWQEQYYVPALRALGDIPAAIAAGGAHRFTLFNVKEENKILGVTIKDRSQIDYNDLL